MKPPTIVGFDAAERTVTLQFAEDIRDRDFAIGAQFGCARNQNSTQFCHEAEEKAHLLAKAREELEAVRAVLLAAHVTNRGTLAEMAADLVETATSYRNAVMAAREEIARLREDKKRLDWLEAHGEPETFEDAPHALVWSVIGAPGERDVRVVIDAARKET